MKYAVIALLCAILLQGCAGSSPSDVSGTPASDTAGRPTDAGMRTGGCGQTFGRISAFQSCRDS
jgi:hypothetical protein